MNCVFYLEKNISYNHIAVFLESLLQLKIDILWENDSDAILALDKSDGDIILWPRDYPGDFPTGFSLISAANCIFRITCLEIAQQLSVHFQMSVVTDLPENRPDYSDPYVWTVAKPDEKLYEIAENMQTLDCGGLVLDYTTQKLLHLPNLE